ncbi:MAG TPA: HAD family hydrolase [Alkalispirochaeta sp.]|nr:HAD family hydrolase [Alkalispirochaeta sp.]
MHISAILFDKDGTLFDFRSTWLPILTDVANQVAQGNTKTAGALIRAAGYDPETDRFVPDGPIAAGNSHDIATAWQTVLPTRDTQELQQLIDHISEVRGPAASVPVCDLSALLDQLSQLDVVAGLATSDSEAGARKTLDRFDITGRFRWISGYDSGTGTKPDPAVVHAFARHISTPSRTIAVVGDTLHDIMMGRNAGAAVTIAVLTGAVARGVITPYADQVIDSIAELPELLLRLRAAH